MFPSDTGCFCLECDASNFVMGMVLSQLQGDGIYHPVRFISKGFSSVERNYQIHDKEFLAIICTLEEWHHFLEGAAQTFEIHTVSDNFSLTHQPGELMG